MTRSARKKELHAPAGFSGGRAARARWRAAGLVCCMLLCILAAACGGGHTASPPALPVGQPQLPAKGQPQEAPPAGESGLPAVWLPLAEKLAADGLSGPRVEALLLTLGDTPTQSPMGRKMRELYLRKFFPRPPAQGAPPRYYKGVVSEGNAGLCRDFVEAHREDFERAEKTYAVPPAIAAALLFVETRLGTVLGDVPENAFQTLAGMAVSRTVEDIADWLPRMPEYEKHLDWFAEVMPRRADWAYKEVRALMEYMLRENAEPETLPGSIYGAVGLCQFMPSNIAVYGVDGDADGRVDLLTVPDAVASLANYLARHGWKAGLSRQAQHGILMKYNKSVVYANTILALADLVEGRAAAPAPPAKKTSGKAAKR